MNLMRKQDLSVYYYMKDLFKDSEFVAIKDGYPLEDIVLPTVSVDAMDTKGTDFELGSRKKNRIRSWQIDIFAKNKSQRDDIGYSIMDALDDYIPVYDYDEGFPPDVSPTRLGSLQPDEYQMRVIRIDPILSELLYYRAAITLRSTYSKR